MVDNKFILSLFFMKVVYVKLFVMLCEQSVGIKKAFSCICWVLIYEKIIKLILRLIGPLQKKYLE